MSSTLILNIGSSSIKYDIYQQENIAVQGALTGLGTSFAKWEQKPKETEQNFRFDEQTDLATALDTLLEHLKTEVLPTHIIHRVVHGSDQFMAPTLLNELVLKTLQNLIPLAPLHLPSNLLGIQKAMHFFPKAQSIAVFDTAFHHTLPPSEQHYPLPHTLCQQHSIRRFGFHGMSHAYAAKQAKALLNTNHFTGVILHLGSGASMCAIENDVSQATTMGMTPLGGLMMGTRCGDMDPGIVLYLLQHLEKSIDEVYDLLNRQSGLLGMCGASDMRACIERAKHDAQARIGLATYIERIRDTLAAYLMKLTAPQAIVFTGGVGENAHQIRDRIVTNMAPYPIALDVDKNKQPLREGPMSIHDAQSKIALLVIPANESAYMMDETKSLRL